MNMLCCTASCCVVLGIVSVGMVFIEHPESIIVDTISNIICLFIKKLQNKEEYVTLVSIIYRWMNFLRSLTS